METFKQIHEAAKHFKEVKTPGIQCLLTEGPATHSKRDRYKQVREGFRQCGVRVTVEGELGARTITLRGFVERNLDVKRRFTASRRQSERHTISQVIDDLNEVGATIYVEGNRHHICRELRNRYGLNSYSSTAHENGIGLVITRIK